MAMAQLIINLHVTNKTWNRVNASSVVGWSERVHLYQIEAILLMLNNLNYHMSVDIHL